MKKLCKMFFLIGFAAFLAMSCDNGSADNGGGTGGGDPQLEQNTYKSADGVITVNTNNDGLLLQASFDKPWKHFTFVVKDVSKNNENHEEWHDSITVETPIKKENGKNNCEVFFPFTEKSREYKIHYIHSGNETNEWDDYTEENGASNCIKISAIGGAGRFDVTCDNAQYWSPRRGLFLKRFNVVEPSLEGMNKRLKVRAEVCEEKNGWARWKNEKDFDTQIINQTIWFPEDENDDFIKYIKGSDKLFFSVEYIIKYNDLDFAQRFYGNWAAKDSKGADIADSNWFIDYDSLDSSAEKLPRIEINSNDRDNEWVALPVAAHVKEQAKEWTNDMDGIPDPVYKDCTITSYNVGEMRELNGAAAEVKVRGNWTTSYEKKSLRIKFKEAHHMLNLHNDGFFKNWVLLACYKDASLLRDAAAMKLYADMFAGQGYYVSDSRLVDLFINGVYWGVYLLAEQQEIQEATGSDPKIPTITHPGRIIAKETKKGDTDVRTGYLVEFDSYSSYEAEDEHFYIDYSLGNNVNKLLDYEGRELVDTQAGYTIKSDVRDVVQHDFIAKYMNKVWEISYKATHNMGYYTFDEDYNQLVEFTNFDPDDTEDEKCRKCVSAIIDVNSLASMYVFNELICDPDLYLTSFFMDVDFSENGSKLLRFEAPWDFDSTMGIRALLFPILAKKQLMVNNLSSCVVLMICLRVLVRPM